MAPSVARALGVAATVLIAVACGPPGPVPSEDAATPTQDAARPTVEIGTRESGAMFTPWHDGDAIPEAWGPQGGVMITPAVAIDGRLVDGESPSLDVTIENFLLPDETPLPGFPTLGPLRAFFVRLDTRLVDGPLFDQLGWSDLTGTRVLVRAHVRGPGLDAVGEVRIVVGNALTPPMDAGQFDGTADGGL
jgi:hypothetical protein